MTFNDLTLILLALASAGIVVFAWKFDKQRLYGVIFMFLILIAIGGGKLAVFFGFETNTGNVFYAAVFLATYFLIERHGKREGVRSLGIGIIGIVFFSILLRLVVALTGAPATGAVNDALSVALAPALRLAFASLCGYVVSQTLNVYLFIYLRERFEHRRLWLRANIANFVAQLFDSLVFFTVAFWGVVPPGNIWEILLAGFITKVLFMMCAAPLLYLNKVGEDREGSFTTLTLY